MLLPQLEVTLGIKFTSIISSTIESLQVAGVSSVGILATPTTIRSRLYEQALLDHGFRVVLPSEATQAASEDVIRDVIAGRRVKTARLNPFIDELLAAGAEKILLGCTELSVVFQANSRDELVDPLRVLSERLLSPTDAVTELKCDILVSDD